MKTVQISEDDFDKAAFNANVNTLAVVTAKMMKDRNITEREGRLMAVAMGTTITALKSWIFKGKNPLPDVESICAAEGWDRT